MFKKEKVLVVLHTEYHVMAALSIIADFYKDADVTIYQTQDFQKKRFQFSKNTNLPGITYKVIQLAESHFTYNEDMVNAMKEITGAGYRRFILFNHHGHLPIYLTKVLKQANPGIKIYLAPDGAKPYADSNKATPRWSTLAAYNYYKFVKANKLPYKWHYPNLLYADLKEIDGVYMHFPLFYKNISKKEVIKFEMVASHDAISLVNSYFNFDVKKELGETENIFFYVNQPAKDKNIYDFEFNLLKEMQDRFTDYKFIIKLHPATDAFQIEKYQSLHNVALIRSTYPAELYIAELKNSIVASFWSSACFINNPNVRIYWLYPLLVQKGIMLNYVSIVNPAQHIIEVNSVNEIL